MLFDLNPKESPRELFRRDHQKWSHAPGARSQRLWSLEHVTGDVRPRERITGPTCNPGSQVPRVRMRICHVHRRILISLPRARKAGARPKRLERPKTSLSQVPCREPPGRQVLRDLRNAASLRADRPLSSPSPARLPYETRSGAQGRNRASQTAWSAVPGGRDASALRGDGDVRALLGRCQ